MFLLISGGTFLYAALVHILPEVTTRAAGGTKEDMKRDMWTMVAGLLTPLALCLFED